MKKVLVKKDDNYYQCQAKNDYVYKCGKCLFGLIFAAQMPTEYPNVCKRCGAAHYSTTWGHNDFDMQVFYS